MKKQTTEQPQSRVRKALASLWAFFLAVLAVLGGFVSLLTIYPRVTVTTAFESSHPLQTSFLVSNDGYFPVYSVSISCIVGEVDATAKQAGDVLEIPSDVGKLGMTVTPKYIPASVLEPGAKELIPMSDCISTETAEDLNRAHLALRVTYKPKFWWRSRTFTQEFYVQQLHKGSFKTFVWYSVPYQQ